MPIGQQNLSEAVDWESSRSGVLTRSLFDRPLWMSWGSCQDLLSSQMGEHVIYCKEKPLPMECRDPWRSWMYELPPCTNPWQLLFSPCIFIGPGMTLITTGVIFTTDSRYEGVSSLPKHAVGLLKTWLSADSKNAAGLCAARTPQELNGYRSKLVSIRLAHVAVPTLCDLKCASKPSSKHLLSLVQVP